MSRYYNNVSHDDLLSSSRALMKFCREHRYPEGGLVRLQECIAALEADNFREAANCFRSIPLGGMGCFNDWFPPVIYDHENSDYVTVIFDSLLERCARLFRTASNESPIFHRND
jgi:hypothetical protein